MLLYLLLIAMICLCALDVTSLKFFHTLPKYFHLPVKLSGISHSYSLNQSISVLRVLVWEFLYDFYSNFLAVPQGCLQFVTVVSPDHTHLLFLIEYSESEAERP